MSSEPRYTIKDTEIAGRGLIVNWADGHRSQFHGVWLRHQCKCRTCGTPMNAVRGIRLHHIPDDIRPVWFETANGEIHVQWSDDDHQSAYTARWLRDHCYSAAERASRKHRPNLWDSSAADGPPIASLADAEASPNARLAMLEAVRDFGFCKISDVPIDEGQSHRLIEAVGPQRQTHYGTYVLSKKASVDNVGDTTSALDPHIDETYRLDAAQNSGGQRRWYMSRLPVIKLDHEGDVSGVRLNERQIAPLDIDADLVEPCYRALRRIFDILYDPGLRATFPLKAGEGLLFDNQRVLHGRTEFTPEAPVRSVLTSSVDLEEFHSTLRLLQIEVGLDAPAMVMSQGMAV